MVRQHVMVSWSSGKDSAWALYLAQQSKDLEVVGVFTTVNKAVQRVAMHGVRLAILEQQAASLGLALSVIEIPYPCRNKEYEQAMSDFIGEIKNQGVEGVVFGDLFLEDIRHYREKQLAESGLSIHFPLWGIPTDQLAQDMVDAGLRAVVVCVDPKQCSAEFAGRIFEAELLAELPKGIDRCGENGEFHTCVYAGPMFKHGLQLCVGEVIQRDGFVFVDVLPAENG